MRLRDRLDVRDKHLDKILINLVFERGLQRSFFVGFFYWKTHYFGLKKYWKAHQKRQKKYWKTHYFDVRFYWKNNLMRGTNYV